MTHAIDIDNPMLMRAVRKCSEYNIVMDLDGRVKFLDSRYHIHKEDGKWVDFSELLKRSFNMKFDDVPKGWIDENAEILSKLSYRTGPIKYTQKGPAYTKEELMEQIKTIKKEIVILEDKIKDADDEDKHTRIRVKASKYNLYVDLHGLFRRSSNRHSDSYAKMRADYIHRHINLKTEALEKNTHKEFLISVLEEKKEMMFIKAWLVSIRNWDLTASGDPRATKYYVVDDSHIPFCSAEESAEINALLDDPECYVFGSSEELDIEI